jgi:hypothetical protein
MLGATLITREAFRGNECLGTTCTGLRPALTSTCS